MGREIFSVVVMGNGKHILPVLHCLEVGIAFVSSWHYWCICYFLHLLYLYQHRHHMQ